MKTANQLAAEYDGAPLMFKRQLTRHPAKINRRITPAQEYKFTGAAKYDGKGGFKADSTKIPLSAWPGAIVVLSLFGFMLFTGSAVGL